MSIGVFIVYIDTGSPVPNIPSKSCDLVDENNTILTEWKWFKTTVLKCCHCCAAMQVQIWLVFFVIPGPTICNYRYMTGLSSFPDLKKLVVLIWWIEDVKQKIILKQDILRNKIYCIIFYLQSFTACVVRFNALSFVYVVCLLICPLLRNPTEATIKGKFKILHTVQFLYLNKRI